MHKIKVDFRIVGNDFSPDQVSVVSGLKPSKSFLKGDKISQTSSLKYKENIWILESSSDSSLDMESYFIDLQNKITPHIEKFEVICKKYYCEFSCSFYLQVGSEDSIPSVHLNREIISFIEKLNAEVDIDIYVAETE